jgi:hypothetical protein
LRHRPLGLLLVLALLWVDLQRVAVGDSAEWRLRRMPRGLLVWRNSLPPLLLLRLALIVHLVVVYRADIETDMVMVLHVRRRLIERRLAHTLMDLLRGAYRRLHTKV